MNVSKVILILLKALVEICLASMKHIESQKIDVTDSAEYNTLGFFLASFRDTIKEYENYENENN